MSDGKIDPQQYPIEVIVRPGPEWVAWPRGKDEEPQESEFIWRARRIRTSEIWDPEAVLDMVCEEIEQAAIDAAADDMVTNWFANWNDRICTTRKEALATFERALDACIDAAMFELAPGLDPKIGERTDG